jgi:hypothetical protein
LLRRYDPDELAAWTQLRNSRDEAALEEFVRSYPRGTYAERARQRLRGLHSVASANADPAAVAPRAAQAATQVAARPAPVAAPANGCFRLARSGNQYVRLCLAGAGGRREEAIAFSWESGSFSGGGWAHDRTEVCSAPLAVADLGGEVRLSWAASTCGQAAASGGSATCRVGDGGALTCGGDVYRRE